jgi:hypothetical protein
MDNTETKSTIENAAREAAESARKAGGKLRTLAVGAADSSRRWAKRSGEALSDGAEFATLQVKQSMGQRRLDRAYLQLGRAVYAAHQKGAEAGSLVDAPEVRAALAKVKEAAENLR